MTISQGGIYGVAKRILISWVFLLLLTGVLIVFSMILWKVEESRHLAAMQSQVQMSASSYSLEIELKYNKMYDGLGILAKKSLLPGTDMSMDWTRDAVFFIDTFSGFNRIVLVDSNMRMKKIVPLQGNDSFLMESVGELPVQPFEISILLPIHSGDTLKGFVLGTVDVEKFIRSIVGDVQEEFAYQVTNEDKTLYQSAEWESRHAVFGVNNSITLQNAAIWNFSFAPTRKYYDAETRLARETLHTGLSFTLLIFLAMLFAQKSTRKTWLVQKQEEQLLVIQDQLILSEQQVRRKLESILSPEGGIADLSLGDIIDMQALQSMMDHFYKLTSVTMGISDMKGQFLVKTGWQEICTKFHRVHPDSCRFCRESDTEFSHDVAFGEYKLYQCKNGMWDISTPIMVGEQKLGNLFLGQFLFEDEAVDLEQFRQRALKYGFDEVEYMHALAAVPRWSREKVDMTMAFSMKWANLIAMLSYRNIQLARSITEKELLLKSLNERTNQLFVANKELESFSYSVSHDLRAPLRHMSGFVELLEKYMKGQSDEKIVHYLSVITQASTKMGVLIDELLLFSRMGRTEMINTVLDMNELFAEVIESCKADAEGREVLWKISRLPAARGDRSMVFLVIKNLVSNALKFSRNRNPTVIEIGAAPDLETTDYSLFHVKDNGVGFDMHFQDKLFGVFQRLHSQKEFEGTGVGLANVQRIILRHGGRVWAEGIPDTGAVFHFTLPMVKEDLSEWN
jgi:signal transduction histidine kinase/sensor domain CHASE-containing protein